MERDDDAVGLKVGDAVAVLVAAEDGFAQQCDVAARLVLKVAADGPAVVDDQHVGGLALGAVDGLFQCAMEGSRWEWGDGVGSGANCGDDVEHKGRQ